MGPSEESSQNLIKHTNQFSKAGSIVVVGGKLGLANCAYFNVRDCF